MILASNDLSQFRSLNSDAHIVLTDGVFDLLHPGHIAFFKTLRAYGDIVVVAILSDQWTQQRKGPGRPVLSGEERLELVDAVRYIDYSLLAQDPSTKAAIPISTILAQLKPDVFVTSDAGWERRSEEFVNLGIELRVVQRVDANGLSTTHVIKRIRDAQFEN